MTVELGPERPSPPRDGGDDAERRRLFDRHAAKMPAFVDYEKRTTRKIPVAMLERIHR